MELTKRIFGGKQRSRIKSQSKGPQPTDMVPVRELAGNVAGLAGASQRVGGTRSQERSGVGGAGHSEPQRSWQDIARASALLRRGNRCGVSSKGVTCAFVGPLWLQRGGEAGAARWEAGRGAERRPQRAAVAVETLPFSRHGLCHRMTPGSHERSHSPRRLGPHVRGGLRFLPPGSCGSDPHSVSHTSAPSRNVLSSSSSVALLVPQALPCCPQAWLRLACPGWLSLSSSTPIRFDLSPVVKQKAWVCLWMNQGTQRTLLLLPPGLGEWHIAAQLPRASWGRPKPVSGGRHMVQGTTRGVMLC